MILARRAIAAATLLATFPAPYAANAQDAEKPPDALAPRQAAAPDPMAELLVDRHRCPHCSNGRMIIVERFERGSSPTAGCGEPARVDNTS